MAARDGDVAGIVGWFRIDKSKINPPNQANIVAELDSAERSLDLYNIAIKHGLSLDPSRPIKLGENETNDVGFTRLSKEAQAATYDGKGVYETIVVV